MVRWSIVDMFGVGEVTLDEFKARPVFTHAGASDDG